MGESTVFPRSRVTIVGVLNATPDSFSDGGRFVHGQARLDLASAVDAAARLVAINVSAVPPRGRTSSNPPSGLPRNTRFGSA